MSFKQRPIQNYKGKEKEPVEAEYARLVKSLYSGLPNEVDFVFNLLTLMSAPGPHSIKLEKCPLLLPLMIAHAGVYGDNECLRDLAENGWKKFLDREFEEFWLSSGITDEDILTMIPIDIKKFKKDDLIQKFFTNEYISNTKNPTRFRIYQAVAHLRNMSFEKHNIYTMGKSDILIQFMTICASTSHVTLIKESLDTLANISSEIDLFTINGDYMHCMMLKIIAECLISDDKQKVLQALEILGGLCQNEKNESVCVEFVDNDIMTRIFQLLTLKDILICIYTLECLYQFSELGRAACNRIVSHDTAINQLINLITVEAASFGRSGLSGIQVVESFPHQSQTRQHYPPVPQQHHHQSNQSQNHNTSQQQPQFRQPYPPSQHTYGPPQTPQSKFQTGRHLSQIPHQRVMIQQQQMAVITNDEKLKNLTVKWIKENCVADPTATAIRGDLYSNYVDYMKNIHGIMSGSVQMFTSLLQSMFNCTIRNEQRDSTMVFLIEGVKFLKQHQPQKQVVANHPVMQKMLSGPSTPTPQTPKPVTVIKQTSVNVNTPKPTTNGVHPKPEEVEKESDKNKDIEEENSEKEKTSEVREESKVEENAIPEINGVPKEIVKEKSAKLQVCSDVVEAKSLMAEEKQHEKEIVKVEVTKEKDEKLINGVNDSKNDEKNMPNGDINGIVNHITLKENEKNESHQNGIIESTSGEVVTDDDEENDESVDNVDKSNDSVNKKNGLKSKKKLVENVITEVQNPTTEIPLENGNGNTEINERKRKKPAPKTPSKKLRKSESTLSTNLEFENNIRINQDTQYPSTSNNGDYMCEWNGCGKLFSTVELIMSHHLVEHLDNGDDDTEYYLCLWPTCDGTKRGKWSLVTHIQDHHCQEHILRQSLNKRNEMGGNAIYLARIKQQLRERPKESMSGIPFTATAACEAIRRHAYVNLQREVIDETEGPVTKCIRLTAALILRNIARYSEDGKVKLKPYECLLSSFAISRLEASTTLAQCLSELNPRSKGESSGINVSSHRRLIPVKISSLNFEQITRN